MTNEEKAKSLWYHFCTENSCDGYDDCKLCPKAQIHPQLMGMAEWKKKETIDKAADWLLCWLTSDDAGLPITNTGIKEFINDFKQSMSED